MVVEARPKSVNAQPDERHVWTYADLLAIPEDSSRRYEILEGKLFVSPSPSVNHLLVVTDLYKRLLRHVDTPDNGLVFASPVDVKRSEYEVVVPDLVFVRNVRSSIVRQGEQAIQEPPDMVVEVISPSSRLRDCHEKLAFYAGFGVQEYWVVDPFQRTCDIYVLRDGVYHEIPLDGGILHSEVVEGFELDVADLFTVLDEEDGATTPSTTEQTAPSAE